MSRTYRKKKEDFSRWSSLEWELSDNFWEKELNTLDPNDIERIKCALYSDSYGQMYSVMFTKKSRRGKEALARWHSDASVYDFKDPGPSWFKKLMTIRPERRYVKNELYKFMMNNEYEVQIYDKYYYEYWT